MFQVIGMQNPFMEESHDISCVRIRKLQTLALGWQKFKETNLTLVKMSACYGRNNLLLVLEAHCRGPNPPRHELLRHQHEHAVGRASNLREEYSLAH